MKRMYAFLFGLLCSLTLMAQNNFPPLHTVQAYHRFNSLLQLPINNGEQARFYTDRAVDFVRSGPLHAEHVYALCQRLNKDNQKLRITKRSYNNVVNRNQFDQLYNVFNKFSTAIELYHFVQQKNINPTLPPVVHPVVPTPVHDPFLNQQEFNHILADLRSIPFSRKRFERAKLIIQNERLNMGQFEGIFAELKDTSYLFELLKFSLPVVPNTSRMYKYKNWLRFNSERRAFEELLLQY